MISWHEISFRITGPLWGESAATGGFPSQRVSNAELDISLMLAWKRCWINSRVTDDFRHNDSHAMSL